MKYILMMNIYDYDGVYEIYRSDKMPEALTRERRATVSRKANRTVHWREYECGDLVAVDGADGKPEIKYLMTKKTFEDSSLWQKWLEIGSAHAYTSEPTGGVIPAKLKVTMTREVREEAWIIKSDSISAVYEAFDSFIVDESGWTLQGEALLAVVI